MQSIDKQVYQAVNGANGGKRVIPLIQASGADGPARALSPGEYLFYSAPPCTLWTMMFGLVLCEYPQGCVVQLIDGAQRGGLYEYLNETWIRTTLYRAALLTGKPVSSLPGTADCPPVIYGRPLTNEHGFDSTKPQTLDFYAGISREPAKPDYRTTYSQATRDMVSEWLAVGGVTECEELYEEAKRRVERRGK